MREILFRGKRKDNGEWVEGYFVNCFDEFYRENGPFPEIIMADAERICAGEYTYDKAVEVIPETVGQWTGLLDKNGKKIFEGDILDTPRWIVSYCADTNAGLGMNAGWYIQRDNFTSWLELENNEWHVVLGNIHDNPELLKSST